MSFFRSFQYFSLLVFCTVSIAGVTNPDISVVGQMRVFSTDDEGDVNHDRAQFSFDESELIFDAVLNPFARGTFVFAVADEAIEVEEGYLALSKGLPDGLALKLGKYRAGFGKLNSVHPHAYPFVERFNVLASYLPGEESFNEIGGQVSYRLPMKSDVASTVSFDVLQGNSFHPDEEESRPALLGRLSEFFMLGGESSMEIGISGAHGVSNVAEKLTTTVLGLDAKAKLWFTPLNVLLVQGEVLSLNQEMSASTSVTPAGGCLFADYTMKRRYNFGARYEQYQRVEAEKPWDASAGTFAGLALMEETTLFRVSWDHFMPDGADAVNTFTLQVVFSMGPHKPHQF